MPGGNVGMVNLGDILGKSMGGKKGKKKKMSVKESHGILVAQESDKMIEEDKIIKEAKKATEENGIVFLDEIDKVSARSDRVGGDVSREGVQRDLLPLIEGTTVSTKHGPIKVIFYLLHLGHFNLLNHLIYYQNYKVDCQLELIKCTK